MGKYIVIAIAMSVRNNRIAEHGEIVDESQLNSPTHELLSGGFIRLATDDEIEASAQVVLDEDRKNDDLKPKESADEITLKARKEKLISVGFVNVELEDFKGLSYPDSGVNFSDEDILGASLEEYDGFIAKAGELSEAKTEDSKKTDVSKKDAVKEALKNK